MARTNLCSADRGIDAFRAALPENCAHSGIADALCALGERRALEKGCALDRDPVDDRLVFIVAGAAKLVAHTRTHPDEPAVDANVQVLAFHFAGDMISALRQSDGDFRLVGLVDCELVVFPTDRFLDVAQADPVLLRWVLTNAMQALHRSRTRMMQLGHKSARQRIADFLVSMAERLNDCHSGACRLILPMSRRDIGDSLGLTIETVSRQFTELRDAGLIETTGRSLVELIDLGALARAAGSPRGGASVQSI
jgi:CRP-like cAMP-binding protein